MKHQVYMRCVVALIPGNSKISKQRLFKKTKKRLGTFMTEPKGEPIYLDNGYWQVPVSAVKIGKPIDDLSGRLSEEEILEQASLEHGIPVDQLRVEPMG